MRSTVANAVAMLILGSALDVPYLAAQDVGKPKTDDVNAISVKQKYSYKVFSSSIPRRVIFTPDGKLFCACDRKDFVVWDTATGKEKSRIETKSLLEISHYLFAFAPDNKHFLFSQYSQSVRRFEIESGREVASVKLPKPENFESNVMSILPNRNQFLYYADGTLQIRDANTGKTLKNTNIFRKDVGYSRIFLLSEDQSRLLTVEPDGPALHIHKVDSGKDSLALKGHEGKVGSACFSPSGKRIASTGDDKTARIWNAHTGELLRKVVLPGEGLCVAFSPNEKWLLVGMGGSKSRILVLDATTGRELISWQGFPDAAKSFAFNPQGNLLAASGGRYIQIWEFASSAASGK